MKRLLSVFIITIFFFPQSEAQSIDPYSEVGLFLGTSYYLGDLNDQQFKLAQPATAINYRYNIDRRFALRGGLWLGEIRGSDKSNEVDTVKIQRNLHFKSPLSELSGMIEFNFFDYETGSSRYPLLLFFSQEFLSFSLIHKQEDTIHQTCSTTIMVTVTHGPNYNH